MAKTKIPGGYIADNAITGDHIADNVITAAMLHTSFTVSSSNLSSIDTDNVSEGASNLYFTNARARGAISVSGDLSYNSSTGVISFTNDAGDIESVVAGSGLTGGGTSGDVTLNIGAGTGITVNADDIAVNMSAFDTDNLSEGSSNLYFTNERVDDRVNSLLTAGTGITLTYNDVANTLTIAGAAQYGDSDVESYLDANGITFPDSIKAQFGASNDLQIYHDGSHSYIADSGTGSLRVTTDAFRVRNAANNASVITGLDAGGVFLYYNGDEKLETTSTGIDVTGNIVVSGTVDGRDIATDGTKLDGIEANATADQTQSEINALGITATGLSGTPDISVGTISSGNITTTGYLRGPSSFTIDPATHGDDTGTVVIAGNLQVDGTTTTINSTTLSVSDKQVTLGYDATTDAANNNAGIVIYRPETSNAYLLWSETNGRFDMNRNLAISQDLYVNASGVQDTTIEIGAGTTSNHYAYIDLVGDATYTDYGLRIIRNNGGANTSSFIYHRGTGNFNIETQEAASILLRTAGTTALTLDSSQNAAFAGTISSGKITANTGDASAQPLTIGSSASTNYTLQNWITSAHSGTSAYMIAYGASHGSQANHFAMKNLASGGEIFFELFGVEPLRLTSTGATFAGTIVSNASSGITINTSDATYAKIKQDYSSADILELTSMGSMQFAIDENNNSTNKYFIWKDGGEGTGGTELMSLSDGGDLSVVGDILLTGPATTTNQGRMIDFTGFDKEGVTDFSDRAYIQHTLNTGGHANSVLVISSQNDSGDGIAFLTNTSSNLKHNSNVVWTAGNDGPGSGLDADTLDGVQGSSYLRSDAADTATGELTLSGSFTAQSKYLSGATNFDALKVSGFYSLYNVNASGHTNAPFQYGAMIQAGNTAQSGGMGMQIAHERTGAGTYIRGMNDTNDTWYAWREIWTAGTDGSGSGLDADTVDGIQGASFLRSDANDTCSGLITFSQDISVGSQTGTWITSDVMSDAIGWNNSYGVYIGSDIGGTHYLRGNGTFTTGGSTYNLWHQGNDGSGSGLDADTLDGVQGSSFLRSDTADTATQAITFSGGIVVDGSIDSGGSDYGFYQSAGTNIILKGDASGRSGIFFQSEKNGTNINHPSDYGFIQFHSYGYGGSSGESIDMVIGTANDSDDHLILQTPYTTGLKFGYRNATSGTGLTQVNIWHAANDGSGSGLDADTLDGINSGSFLRSDADDTLTGHLQINSHAINMDLNNVADDAITMREVRSSTWPLQIVTNAVGNDNHSGFWVGSNGYPDMRLRRDDSTVRALISSWETSYVSNGFTVSGGNLTITGSTSTEDALKTTNGRIQLGPHTSGAGIWLDRGDAAQRWFLGLNSLNSDTLRFWRSGNKWTLDASGNTSQGGSITATDAYFFSGGAGNRFQFRSPTPTIRLIDANATSRYTEIGGENGSCNIAVDPGNAQGSSSFGVTIDGQQALYIDSDDRNYVNTSSNPTPLNATGHLNVLADLGDGVNIKHTVNGNNTINIWQTGSTQHSAIAFYKGDSQTFRGAIYANTGTGSNSIFIGAASDYRLKENVVPMSNATSRVMAMNPVQFDWIESGVTSEGFLAHELAEHCPDAVVGEKDAVYSNGDIKTQTVDHSRLTPLLVKTIQEQQALIESLQTRIEALEGE